MLENNLRIINMKSACWIWLKGQWFDDYNNIEPIKEKCAVDEYPWLHYAMVKFVWNENF